MVYLPTFIGKYTIHGCYGFCSDVLTGVIHVDLCQLNVGISQEKVDNNLGADSIE